ncbi:MAG: ABC transporter permease [Saprospiraceae bacterium]
MIRSFITTALRSFWKTPTQSFINLLGLSVSIAICILIALFVRTEVRYDRFHSKAEQLYRVWVEEKFQDQVAQNTSTAFPIRKALQEYYPEVEAGTYVVNVSADGRRGDFVAAERLHLVDAPDFFKMFDFPIVAGSTAGLERNPSDIVITESVAERYFGKENPIGQSLELRFVDSNFVFNVAAVAKDVPTYSSIRFDIILPIDNAKYVWNERARNSWFNVYGETYVQLKPQTSAAALEQKMPTMLKQVLGDNYTGDNYKVFFQPITDIHLNVDLPEGLEPTSDPTYLYILSTIAIFILFIACINFITLSVGRSAGRAREVGVRKVLGAGREMLIRQFWSEALLMTLGAVLVGLLLAKLALPEFSEIANTPLKLTIDGTMVLFLVGLILIVGLLAGMYPAVILSKFQPVEVLKGKLSLKGDHNWFRRGLLLLQFTMSALLIVGTMVINQQMNFIRNKSLGFNSEYLVNVEIPQGRIEARQTADLLRNQLRNNRAVVDVTASMFDFGAGWGRMGYTDDQQKYREVTFNMVDENYLATYDIELVKGRNFEPGSESDRLYSLIVNEALVKEYGWEDPLTARFPNQNFTDYKIIGVVKNFNYASLRDEVQPLAMFMAPDSILRDMENVMIESSSRLDLAVRFQAGDPTTHIGILEETWKALVPNLTFNYAFVDQNLEAQYQRERTLGRIVNIASVLSIFIACLGLFGLTMLAVVRRTKEIGIRKVLGAKVGSIVLLLSKDFIWLVVAAFVLAMPIAWYAMNRWLEDFAYRIQIQWWMLALAGVTMLAIALLTVSVQAIRAAVTNPVKNLRSE